MVNISFGIIWRTCTSSLKLRVGFISAAVLHIGICTFEVNLAAQVKLYKLHAHLKFTLHNCNDNYQQVRSNSVACAFKLLKKGEYKETSRFCSMFNRFFDCFNARRAGEGKEKRNPDLDPYTNVDDIRLTVCKLKA